MSKLLKSLEIFKSAAAGKTARTDWSVEIDVKSAKNVKWSGGRLTLSGFDREDAAAVKRCLNHWAKDISFSATHADDE